MKKTLLISSLLVSGASMAQFTQGNEPAIGDSRSFYIIDTMAPDYATTTGTDVTWDYSGSGSLQEGGIANETLMSIVAPSDTDNGEEYASATKAIEIAGYMTSYFASSTSSRNSKGFVFDQNVIVLNDANDELLMNYPFAISANLTDAFTGTAQTTFGNLPVTGNVTATVDGSGTLILNDATTLTGVLRYKLVDQATATIPIIGSITMSRTQYEYYHFASGNLPVFVHSKIDIGMPGSALQTQRIVLNSVEPDGFASVGENQLSGVAVYPNPATENISVSGLTDNATLTLIDMQGKTVVATAVQAGTSSMEVSNIESGIYMLHITTAKGSKIERVVIR